MDDTVIKLVAAVEESDYPTVAAILSSGVDFASLTVLNVKMYPLHQAASKGDVDMVKLMLGFSVVRKLVDSFDDFSNTPLMAAVAEKHLQVAEMLLNLGADVNACEETRIGNYALKIAVENVDLPMTQLLLSAGADPTKKGWMQITALQAAQRFALSSGTKESGMILDCVMNPGSPG